MTKRLSFIALLIVAGCTNYQVSTNLDPQAIKDYFAPSQVKVFTDSAAIPANAHYIGLVEGDSCQANSRMPEASDVEARTAARVQAHSKNANAVVFTACTAIETPGCVSSRVCYAKAYYLLDAK